MPGEESKTLPCGCVVRAYRDFLGRVVGEVRERGADCPKPEHQLGQVLVMPGREHARPE